MEFEERLDDSRTTSHCFTYQKSLPSALVHLDVGNGMQEPTGCLQLLCGVGLLGSSTQLFEAAVDRPFEVVREIAARLGQSG